MAKDKQLTLSKKVKKTVVYAPCNTCKPAINFTTSNGFKNHQNSKHQDIKKMKKMCTKCNLHIKTNPEFTQHKDNPKSCAKAKWV